MPSIKYYLIILFVFPSIAFSQLSFDPIYTLPDSGYFNFNTNKNQNIYNFSNQFNYTSESEFGTVFTSQNYSGEGTPQTTSRSYQESQTLRLFYTYPLYDNFKLVNKNNWFISSNTLNYGLNKLERINAMLGGQYLFLDNSYIEALYGAERNTAVGIEEFGNVYSVNTYLDKLEFEGFSINSRGYSEYVELNDGRKNNDILFNLNSSKDFEDNSTFNFSLNYKNRARDNPELNQNIMEVPVRRRLSNALRLGADVNFELFDLFRSNISLGINSENITNSYLNSFEQLTESNYKRDVEIFGIDLGFNFAYNSEYFKTVNYINYNQNSEDYTAVNILDLPDDEFNIYRQDQNRQDRNLRSLSIKTKNIFDLSAKDSINFNFGYEIFKYDTPSEKNNDDRDEQSIRTEIEYLRKISNILYIGLNSDMRFNHYVYIKASRSSSNNMNRIIRISPVVLINSKDFYYRGLFGVNANYTVYDFENIVTGINSFSFREISYRDSIRVALSKNYSIESKSYLNYSERGILYWDDFEEQPQRANLEIFSNLLLFKNIHNFGRFGAGLRYYKRNDKRIGESLTESGTILSDFESFAPEVFVEYHFSSNNRIYLDFWYEFQNINLNEKRNIPNFFLTSQINL